MKIALAGGGTGGHLIPGLSVAQAAARSRPSEVWFLHGGSPVEERLLASTSFRRTRLPSTRLPRGLPGVPGFTLRALVALWRSLRVLHEFRPDAVVGLGGHVSVFPALAARLLGLPLYVLEQNVCPGKANALLARLAEAALVHFPETVDRMPAARLTGTPLREGLLRCSVDEAAGRLSLDPARPTLLVTGGSLGASALNRFVLAHAPLLEELLPGAQVIHLTGDRDLARAVDVWRASGVRHCVASFLEDMSPAYRLASLVLARAGGTTVAELTAFGLPSVLVPYPHHRDGHQRENARALAAAGGARVVEESALDEAAFRATVELLGDAPARERMARASAGLGRPDAADRVVGFLERTAEGR